MITVTMITTITIVIIIIITIVMFCMHSADRLPRYLLGVRRYKTVDTKLHPRGCALTGPVP